MKLPLQVKFLLFTFLFLIAMASWVHAQAPLTLRLLIWEGYVTEGKIAEFEKLAKEKHNIDLNITMDYIVDENQVFEAARLKKYDLITPGLDVIEDKRFDFVAKKIVEPLDRQNLTNYSSLLPNLQNPPHLVKDGKLYGVAIATGPCALIYNTEIITEEPTSLSILWDPKYKNKYGVGNIPPHLMYTVAMASGYKGEQVFDYDRLSKDQNFVNNLNTLLKNRGHMWEGTEKVSDIENLAMTFSWGFSLPELHKKGKKWKMLFPVEGQVGWVDQWMITHAVRGNPQLKQLAEEFINFTLSKEYQTDVIVKGISSEPVRGDVIPAMKPDEFAGMTHLLKAAEYAKTRTYIRPLDLRNRKGFDSLWKQALEAK